MPRSLAQTSPRPTPHIPVARMTVSNLRCGTRTKRRRRSRSSIPVPYAADDARPVGSDGGSSWAVLARTAAFWCMASASSSTNFGGASTGSGSQCVWAQAPDSPGIVWATSWDWAGRDDKTKSYAAAVTGWHGGWRVAGAGLPVQLSSILRARTSWEFDLTPETLDKANVTYDVWLSDDPDHDQADPTG